MAYAKKYGRRTRINSRYKPLYPMSAERDCIRAANAYMNIYKQVVKEFTPAIILACNRQYQKEFRTDALGADLGSLFDKMKKEFEKRTKGFGLWDMLFGVAKKARNTIRREWKKAVSATLGKEVPPEYYTDEFYDDMLKTWVDENVNKITSLPGESMVEMRNAIYSGFAEGKSVEQIAEEIMRKYNTTASYARCIARDQISTLNYQVTRYQQESVGVKKYRWECLNDSRVRESHRAFNGKAFWWDDPPEMWHTNSAGQKIYEGRRCHPGQDYMCRCIAVPVFED